MNTNDVRKRRQHDFQESKQSALIVGGDLSERMVEKEITINIFGLKLTKD
jgi:hypothetical protein